MNAETKVAKQRRSVPELAEVLGCCYLCSWHEMSGVQCLERKRVTHSLFDQPQVLG